MKKALIAFLGNPYYDTRTLNLYKSLTKRGIKVKVIGFEWKDSSFISKKGEISVYKLNKSFCSLCFYIRFVAILKYHLFLERADYYFAEDVQTLPFISVIGKLKRGKVLYDSRELYGFLAGLKNKKTLQKSIQIIEGIFIRLVDYVITTGNMDTDFIKEKFKLQNVLTLRNLPIYKEHFNPVNIREKFNIQADDKVLLYQGVVLHGRGLRLVFEAIKKVGGFSLLIVGDGEEMVFYKQLAVKIGIENRVVFAGRVSQDDLLNLTAGADIGLAVIENLSLSYFYALPNKLFEYIMAGKPVIASNFPQMKEVIEKYDVGYTINPDNEQDLVEVLLRIKSDPHLLEVLQRNCETASTELHWEKEFETLEFLFSSRNRKKGEENTYSKE
jgi:glycosyltransferase involved in cell wall biosynthesis